MNQQNKFISNQNINQPILNNNVIKLAPPPPVPKGFNNRNINQQQFQSRNLYNSSNQNKFNNNILNQSNDLNTVSKYGPFYNNYDFNLNAYSSDDQYVNDLKQLNDFYTKNNYCEILNQKYNNFEFGWIAPRITIPLNDLYARLRYYDNLLSFEQLSPDQIIEVKAYIDVIIKQILAHDDYEFYKKNGYERLTYNNNSEYDNIDDSFRNVKFYQLDSDLVSWGDENNNCVPIALPKNKWWMTQPYYFSDESYFVNFVSQNQQYPNELLMHPMFDYLNDYGIFENLDPVAIIQDFPQAQTTYSQLSDNDLIQQNNDLNNKNNKKQSFWNKLFKSKKNKEGNKESMNNVKNQTPEHTNFPKKENPPPPQPTIMPKKENPPPPQPTIMPPKPNTPPPPLPGKGFGSGLSQVPMQNYFNYQQK